MNDQTKAMSANNAMEILSRQNFQPHKEFSLHVKTLSPNKLGGTACVRVVEMYKGMDWDDGKFLIETEHQLTQLSPEDVAAIRASVKEGQSWHVYQQYKKHDETVKQLQIRITELEAQKSDLLELHNALAVNQSIWPNNWNQQVAMIAYHFHLMQAQLADAKQVANDCRIVADNAIAEALAAKKDAERYQWLRSEHGIDLPVAHVSWKLNQNRDSTVWVNTSDANALDQDVDAAIAEGKA
jgi:hypothetical protein